LISSPPLSPLKPWQAVIERVKKLPQFLAEGPVFGEGIAKITQ
jgi:hypothetical protein